MSFIKNIFNKVFVSKYVGSFVRHTMTTIAGGVSGWLLAKGIIADDTAVVMIQQNSSEIIIATIMYFLGQGGSIMEKNKR